MSRIKKIAVILILALIACALFLAYYLSSTDNLLVQEGDGEGIKIAITTEGLDAQPGEEEYPNKSILVSKNKPVSLAGNVYSVPYLYEYQVREKTLNLISFYPAKEAVQYAQDQYLILSNTPQDYENSNTWQPYLFDRVSESITPVKNVQGHNVRDIAVSQDGEYYSYSFIADPTVISEFGYIGDWSIAIHRFDQAGDPIIIKSAAQASWRNDSASIVYLKHDGVYYLNLADMNEVVLTNQYAPHAVDINQLVINQASSLLLLVSPKIGSISVLLLQEDSTNTDEASFTVVQKSQIITDDRPIGAVQFVDDNFYGYLKTDENDIDQFRMWFSNDKI